MNGLWYSDNSYIIFLREDGSEEKIAVVADCANKTWYKNIVARNTWDFDPGFKVNLPFNPNDVGKIIKVKVYMTCIYPDYRGKYSFKDETVLFSSEHNIKVISQQDLETIREYYTKKDGKKASGPLITIGLLFSLYVTISSIRHTLKKNKNKKNGS